MQTKPREVMKGATKILIGASVGLAAAFAWGATHAVAAIDDFGSTAQTAAPIRLNAPVAGQIDSRTDQDWFVLPPLGGAPGGVTAMGDGFSMRVAIFDGDLRQVAAAPGPTATPMNGVGYLLALPPGTRDPVRVQVTAAGASIGRYSLIVQASAGEPTPLPPAPLPPPPPSPAPPPPVPTDDVLAGQSKAIVANPGTADGRIEVAGDVDSYTYVAIANGAYLLRLAATDGAFQDGVADVATAGGPVQLAVWFADPVPVAMTAGEVARISVHSLGGDAVGSYRIEVTSPAPPPPAAPSGEVTLPFDATLDALQRTSSAYAPWEYSTYRFRDSSSVNGELMAAAAMHDRFVARERGRNLPRASADSTGSLDAVIRRLGVGLATMNRTYAAFATRLSQGAVVGGGSTAMVLRTLHDGLDAGRPVVLAGKKPDGLLKTWIVYGIETVNGIVTLKAIDPSLPGRIVSLRLLGDRGIEPQILGGRAPTDRFSFAGFDKDTLP